MKITKIILSGLLSKASEKSEAFFLSFISKSSATLKLKINDILAKHFKY
jgi:hypothetical protein